MVWYQCCFLEDCYLWLPLLNFFKVATGSASDSPKDFGAGQLKMGQRDNSKTVSTEALMTVYHPQDVENLDSKMVRDKMANTSWNWIGKEWSISKLIPARLRISSGALLVFFHLHFLYLESTGCFFIALFNFLLILFDNDVRYLQGVNFSCFSTPQGRVDCLFYVSERVGFLSEFSRYKVTTTSLGAMRLF